jgi:two-component system response regulator FixJ
MTDSAVVHIVDDDEAVRDSLAFLLKSAKLTVETHASAAAFLAAPSANDAACVLTDVRMPGMSGVELLNRLKNGSNPPAVIVMSGHGDVPLAVEAMKFGAFDFIEKPFDDDLILASIRDALTRKEKSGKREAERAEVLDKLATLSARERQVLEGLVAGQANKSIAFELQISPRTVEIYRANAMTKMRAGSLSQLVRMAIAGGVLSVEADG